MDGDRYSLSFSKWILLTGLAIFVTWKIVVPFVVCEIPPSPLTRYINPEFWIEIPQNHAIFTF
jgi:hypothetical protein